MKLFYSGLTQKGRNHPSNEDAFLVFIPQKEELWARKGALFLIADGVGGHQEGALASKLATEIIRDIYYSHPKEGIEALKEAFWKAHKKICQKALELQNNMATTATALVLLPSWFLYGHVGNTRLYLLREKELKLLTPDHTLVADLLRKGIISKEEAKRHPKRHILTQALGINIEPFFGKDSLREGDRFILCSDGVHEFLEEKEIKKILLKKGPLSQQTREIMDLLAKKRYPDDATLVLVETALNSSVHRISGK